MRRSLWLLRTLVLDLDLSGRRAAAHVAPDGMQSWKTFLEGVPGLPADLQLDDVVLTGRVAFARAANASPELISEHAGIGTKAAAKYSDHMPSRPESPREVMSQLNQQRKRNG